MQHSLIGIFGGTFDPIHLGHIKIAEQALQTCYLQKVLFIPCYQPHHRTKPIASPTQRLQMVQLAIKDYANFDVDDREIKRQDISFMFDTLQSLRQDYPHDSLCLILGHDSFATLDKWHKWQELINYANLIVINRPNIQIDLSEPVKNLLKTNEIFDATKLQTKSHGLIYQLNITPIPISATEIREQLQQQKTPINTLPTKVYEYIIAKKIYL
jgi:nicotinate-nucleotide adenylyltransferase